MLELAARDATAGRSSAPILDDSTRFGAPTSRAYVDDQSDAVSPLEFREVVPAYCATTQVLLPHDLAMGDADEIEHTRAKYARRFQRLRALLFEQNETSVYLVHERQLERNAWQKAVYLELDVDDDALFGDASDYDAAVRGLVALFAGCCAHVHVTSRSEAIAMLDELEGRRGGVG